MKSIDLQFVVLADQVDSRSGVDRVPAALAALAGLRCALPFERTAGDELQGLVDDPAVVVETIVRLTRLQEWRIGVGAGTVETPLPTSTRAARGGAYLAARTAITRARRTPGALALVLDPASASVVGDDRYGGAVGAAQDAETALWLLCTVLERRSTEGWELVDLLEEGLTNAEAAARLGVSASAVSQRLSRAVRPEGVRGAELCTRLLSRLQDVGTREPA
ncbi:MAG: sigma factor-like helix-turn-helix DNA-binding protein [Propionicimonas sp.]|uniref:sigma factor-like helix-turn-helix DNA-binding protein n=1 Tax=Propionicimonas sp. TaxID=1955623 RepID=UPI003D11D73B